MELKHFSLLAKTMPPAAGRYHCTILAGAPEIRIFTPQPGAQNPKRTSAVPQV